MSTSEASWHALYARLGDVLGEEDAERLMKRLPPEDSSQLATKSDVDLVKTEVGAVRSELKVDIARLDKRFDRLEDQMNAMLRTFVTALVGGMAALTTIFSLIVVVWA